MLSVVCLVVCEHTQCSVSGCVGVSILSVVCLVVCECKHTQCSVSGCV